MTVKAFDIPVESGKSRIMVGQVMDSVGKYLPAEVSRMIIITDENVRRFHGHRFPDAGEVITIGTGEAVKTLETAKRIYERLVFLEADRFVFLLGIGGGIVCDITGFVASTYLRGVRFGYMPTTLLAQVDASVGGKTGVNFNGYKNIIGTFAQPETVFCDPRFLTTLPEEEVSCGLAEIVKHAAIADAGYFAGLEGLCGSATIRDPAVIEPIVYRSVEIKAGIVARDEREKGERRKLNFGHTLGHALEKTTGMRHGSAVSIGMAAAGRISREKNLLTEAERVRLVSLLESFNLPTRAGDDMDVPAVMDALARDKKRQGEKIHFVLLCGIGNAVVEPIPIGLLEEALTGMHHA